MDCREFKLLLERFPAASRDDELRAQLAEHAAGCDDCGDLLEGSGFATLRDDEAEFLTSGIMERTSGSPCDFAYELIGDPAAPETDRLLLAAHLEHCGGCAELAETLDWADAILPAMAELDPGPGFTESVLAATAGETEVRIEPGAIERMRERWLGMLRRPRFSLEGAYVATLILVLIFGTPLSPAKSAPPKALEALKAGPGALVGALAPHLRWLQGGVSERGQVVWTAGGTRFMRVIGELGDDLAERNRRAAPAAADLRKDAGDCAAALSRIDMGEARDHLTEMGEDIERIWSGYFGSDPAPSEDETTDENTIR